MQPITYMTSLFTFYLKGEIKSEQNFISFKVPNTILGLIPLGAQTEKFTISQIASTATNTRLSLKYLLLGILLVLWGFSGLTESFLRRHQHPPADESRHRCQRPTDRPHHRCHQQQQVNPSHHPAHGPAPWAFFYL